MKFDDLVSHILVYEKKKGVDPLKFFGAPLKKKDEAGFAAKAPSVYGPSSGNIENPEKYVPVNKGPADKGRFIPMNVAKYLKAAVIVTASDPQAGRELRDALKEFGIVWMRYSAAHNEAKTLYLEYERLRNKESERAMDILYDARQAEKAAGEFKTQLDEMTPDVIVHVREIIKKGALNFVKTLTNENKKEKTFKSLQDIEVDVLSDDEKQAVKYLNDILGSEKQEFEPLSRFIEVEQGEGKNPMVRLLTVYKTALDNMVTRGLVGNIDGVINYLTGGRLARKTQVALPHVGKQALKKKDPAIPAVIKLIRSGKWQEAKDAVLKTGLDDQAKAKLMNDIEKLNKGEITEADVIRPLYAQ